MARKPWERVRPFKVKTEVEERSHCLLGNMASLPSPKYLFLTSRSLAIISTITTCNQNLTEKQQWSLEFLFPLMLPITWVWLFLPANKIRQNKMKQVYIHFLLMAGVFLKTLLHVIEPASSLFFYFTPSCPRDCPPQCSSNILRPFCHLICSWYNPHPPRHSALPST